MPRLKGSADLLKDRRRRALALLDERLSLNEVGRRVGCNASSVMRCRDARRRMGSRALEVRFSPGRPLKLNQSQRKRLARLLVKGPLAQGYRTNLWTTARIAALVEQEFGVRYHPDHIGRLMHTLGWSAQKPERRALERDEQAIERWKQKEWPRKKNARRLGAHIVFADESGFMLIPNVVRTWAPQGQTPIHRHRQARRDKISVISGISLSPRCQRLGLYYLLFYDNIGQEEVCLFLRELLRQLNGPRIVLLDNSSTHKGQPIAELQRRHRRLRIEYFPSYAPELNPDEGVWAQAKRQLANSCPHDVEELSKTSNDPSTALLLHRKNSAAASCNPNCLHFCASLLHYLCSGQ